MKALWITLVLYGAASVALPGGWLATRPARAQQEIEYVADPMKGVYHVPGCPYLDGENLAHFPHRAAAESFGRPCEHCLSESRRTTESSRP